MTSDITNYQREYSPGGSYSSFQFEGSDLISVSSKLNKVKSVYHPSEQSCQFQAFNVNPST